MDNTHNTSTLSNYTILNIKRMIKISTINNINYIDSINFGRNM